ncbi:MAG: glycosyltransferase family 4 protein [Thermodesulfobacteriota bacterium]
MKILMIAPVPFFAPRGTPISILGRLMVLSSLGHEVHLITYPVGKDIFIPGVRIYRTTNLRFIKEVPVGPSWIKLLLDVFLIIKAFRMLRSTQYDLLHTHEEACVFGSMLCKVFKVRHLYDFHSSIPQALKNFGYDRFPILIRFFEWTERWVIHSSNGLIAISPALADYVRKINDKIPIVTIEDTVGIIDDRSISIEEIQKLKLKNPQLDGKKIVLYTGTLELYQGIDLLISSASLVVRNRNDVMFVLVGGKPNQVKHYCNLADKAGLSSNFLFTGMLPPEETLIFVKIADVLVSPRIKGNNTPSKVYSYLRSGKPIIATNHISHTQVLNPDVAVLVEPNPEAFAQGLLTVLQDSSLARKVGEKGRLYFERNYSYDHFVNLTDKIYKEAAK